MLYKLQKISIKQGHGSMVGPGRATTGSEINAIDIADPANVLTIKNINDIKENMMIMVGRGWSFIKTSPIESVEKIEGGIRFNTMTSTYELTILEGIDSDGFGDDIEFTEE